MRLTLRTLLAYRDGVLDPADAAVLETKIRESAMSQTISARIDEGMRNRKLAPIPVDAREFGLDANHVADFLDDTIAPEQLPEIERKCLENNALLSEIGSCHQILSRALAVPMSAAPSLRERIHSLPTSAPRGTSSRVATPDARQLRVDSGSRSPQQLEQSDSAASNVAIDTASVRTTKPTLRKPKELGTGGIELNDEMGRQVPEYLLGTDRKWIRQFAVIAGLVALLVLVGAMAIGPLDQVANMMTRTERAPRQTRITDRDLGGVRDSAGDEESEIVETAAAPPPVRKPSVVTDEGSTGEANGTDTKGELSTSTEKENTEKENTVANSAEDSISERMIAPPRPTMTEASSNVATPALLGRALWLPETKSSSESIVFAQATVPTPSLRILSAGEKIEPNTRLVIPPAYRTEFQIGTGIRWVTAGETEMIVQANEARTQTRVNLIAGRALVFASPDLQRFELQAAGSVFEIGLETPESACAIECVHTLAPRTDNATPEDPIACLTGLRVIGLQGTTTVALVDESNKILKGAKTPVQSVVAQTAIKFQSGTFSEPTPLTEAPWWIRTSVERPVDQYAATDIYKSLSTNGANDVASALVQLAQHKRPETAALATRTRLMLGKYDLVFGEDGALNRRTLQSHWQSIAQQIPQSLGTQDKCEEFMKTLRASVGDRIGTVISLLVPKTEQQLVAGADAFLVECLSSSAADERILAIGQLTKITGKNLGYQPDKASAESIQQWQKALNRGEIRYAQKLTAQPGTQQ